jgi:uncharacterized protein YdaT
MPWNKNNYPNSMKNLPVDVRNKAIDIANALLDEKPEMDEGIIIATSISRAKDWATNRDISIELTNKNAKTTDVKEHGQDQYVLPQKGNKWAVKKEGKQKKKVYRSKPEAVRAAKTKAKKSKGAVTVQKRTGKVEKRTSYNPNKKVSKIKSR